MKISKVLTVILLVFLFISCSNPKHKEYGKEFERIKNERLNDSLVIKTYSYHKTQYDSVDNRWYFIEYVEIKDTVLNRHTSSNGPDIEFIGPRLTPNGFEVLPGEPGISFD